jgi:MFS family permease
MNTMATVNLRAWHRAILVFFSVIGLVGSSLMVRLPLVRENLAVTVGELGLLLVAGSVGAMTGLLLVGKFIAKRGTRTAALVGLTIWAFGSALYPLSLTFHSPLIFVIAGLISGFGAGVTDVAINVDGSAIEQRLGRAALPKMHAAFSIGALVGAGVGTLAAAIDFDIVIQLSILIVLAYALPMLGVRYLPTDNGLHTEEEKSGNAGPVFSKVVVLLGLGIFGMTLAEGASNDWLTIGLVDDYGQDHATAGIAYAILIGAMTVVRFFGGGLVDRFGKAMTLRVTGIIGLIGLLILVAKISVPMAWFGSALWGIGVALAFPLFLSAAGELPNPARKVATVSTFGYAAFLVGPPLLGLVAEGIGSVVTMYWIILFFIGLSVIVAGAAGNARGSVESVESK